MFVTALMDAIGQGSQTRSAVEKRDSTLECVVQVGWYVMLLVWVVRDDLLLCECSCVR